MKKIIDIEGVGEVYAQKLQAAGIKTVEDLLEHGATPKGREQLVEKTGISGALILRWVNHADLIRIVGVAEQFAELLEASGVDSVPELRTALPRTCMPRWSRSTSKSIWSSGCRRLARFPAGSTNARTCLASCFTERQSAGSPSHGQEATGPPGLGGACWRSLKILPR